jgi:enhancer of mRNA-decapping protein 4
MGEEEEPFRMTPVPTVWGDGSAVEVTIDTSGFESVAQQPQSQQIAVYEAKQNEDCINGSLLDVNQHFIVYAVKNGLIRVLHRHSALKALLRGHAGQQVTDIQFFLDGDVLGTVGSDGNQSTLIVWRVFEQSPEITSEKLLEIPSSSFTMNRLIWHPFNPNQFWMFHTTEQGPTAATLVETTRIQTTMHPQDSHAVCQSHNSFCVMEGAVQLAHESAVTDLAWSARDSRHVLTVHESGPIILWDLQEMENFDDDFTKPKQVAILEGESDIAQSRCCFLPHENSVSNQDQTSTITTCFVTASEMNSVFTLWSSFTASRHLPTKLQVVRLQNPSPSYVVDLCFGPAPQNASPPSCFLLLADRHKGKLFAFHVKAQWSANQKALCVGTDYVVPFQLKHPVYSWSVICSPTQDLSEEEIQEQAGLIFDMQLFSYQSKVIQCLTLTSYMCLPPKHVYEDSTPGVTVQALDASKSESEVGTIEPKYDEEYDVEEDDEPEAPEPILLPAPDDSSSRMVNPFANWLGAIASQTAPTSDPPMPPPPLEPADKLVSKPPGLHMLPPGFTDPVPVTSNSGSVSTSSSQLLNPLELLSVDAEGDTNMNGNKQTEASPSLPSKQNPKGNSKKSRSKSPKGKKNKQKDLTSPFDGKISILKREGKNPPHPPQPTLMIPPSDPAIIPVDPAIISSMIPSPTQPPATQVYMKDITRVVEEVMTTCLEPTVQKVVQESLVSFGRPLQTSLDNLGKQGVSVSKKDIEAALDVETPLKVAMAETIRNVFIPTVESITAQVLEQAIKNIPMTPPPQPNNSKSLEMLVKQLVAMNEKMDAMTREIKELKANRAASPSVAPTAPMPPPQPNKTEIIKKEIQMLLKQQQYEAAFTKALSASTAEMAVYCCSRADMAFVIGSTPPALSQPILLCLMQQLGAALLSPNTDKMDLQTILTWLQELALTLKPADPTIQRHVPAVLQQLVGNISQKTAQGEPHLRRPLQMLLQVIRGMQMG